MSNPILNYAAIIGLPFAFILLIGFVKNVIAKKHKLVPQEGLVEPHVLGRPNVAKEIKRSLIILLFLPTTLLVIPVTLHFEWQITQHPLFSLMIVLWLLSTFVAVLSILER